MRLKALTASLISMSLAACATQSMHAPQASLDEKVYAGYEQLLGKQSYAFDGEVRINVEALPTLPKTVNPTVQTELNKLAQQRKLTPTERQWLDEGIAAEQDTDSARSKIESIVAMSNRFYMQFDGVVDIGHGQFSINPKIGYNTQNAQAWVAFPLALDLRQSKFYADLSAFSPAFTDPQYDGRFMLFDYAPYAKLLKDRNLDVKPLILLLKQYMLLNPALNTAQDYQTQALTATDKQKGGVLRVRYQTNYITLIQQNLLFLYLNQPYLEKQLSASSSEDKMDALQSGLKLLSESPSEDSTAKPETAQQARQRLITAVHATLFVSDTGQESSSEVLASEDGNAEQSAAQQVDLIDTFVLAGTSDQTPKEQLKASLKAFDQYRTGELISAKQVKKIVAEQPEAYANLAQVTAELFKDGLIMLTTDGKAQISTDMVLDSKGRFIRADSTMKLSALPEYGIGAITGTVKYNIHDYGSARVDSQALRQAVPYKHVLNKQSPLAKLNKWAGSDSASSTKDWSKAERYQQLARSLLAKKMTKFEVYHSVLWYASLVEADDLDAEQIKQLEQEVLFASLQQATLEGWSLSSQQKQQLQSFFQQELSAELLSESATYYVDGALESVFKQADLQQSLDKLHKQGKSTAQIFASLYEQLDRQANHIDASQPYGQSWLELFKTLGQVAAQDLKNQKIDQNLLQNLDEVLLSHIDYDIYEQVYQLLLDHP